MTRIMASVNIRGVTWSGKEVECDGSAGQKEPSDPQRESEEVMGLEGVRKEELAARRGASIHPCWSVRHQPTEGP